MSTITLSITIPNDAYIGIGNVVAWKTSGCGHVLHPVTRKRGWPQELCPICLILTEMKLLEKAVEHYTANPTRIIDPETGKEDYNPAHKPAKIAMFKTRTQLLRIITYLRKVAVAEKAWKEANTPVDIPRSASHALEIYQVLESLHQSNSAYKYKFGPTWESEIRPYEGERSSKRGKKRTANDCDSDVEDECCDALEHQEKRVRFAPSAQVYPSTVLAAPNAYPAGVKLQLEKCEHRPLGARVASREKLKAKYNEANGLLRAWSCRPGHKRINTSGFKLDWRDWKKMGEEEAEWEMEQLREEYEAFEERIWWGR